MTSHIQNFAAHVFCETLPLAFNCVGTGLLTLAGQYAPKTVERLSFEMDPNALAFGAAYVSLAGSLMNALNGTVGSEKTKSQAARVLLYALAAFASAYFLPQAAKSAGWTISQENAKSIALASVVSNFVCMMLQNS